MEKSDFLGCFVRLSDIPAPDESYMLPWTLDMIYEIEPKLREIADAAVAQKRRRFYDRVDAYTEAKGKSCELIGWYSRDPRLRVAEAWDCFFNYILNELQL